MLASEVCLVCLLSLSSLVGSFVSVGMVPIVLSNTSIRLHGQPSELRNCNITLPYHKWSPKRSPSPGFPDHLQQKKWSPQTIHGTVDGLPFNHPWHCRWPSLQPSMALQMVFPSTIYGTTTPLKCYQEGRARVSSAISTPLVHYS